MEINKKYEEIHGYGIGITQELISDIAGSFTDLIKFDYDLVKKEVRMLTDKAEAITVKISDGKELFQEEKLILRFITSILYPFTSNGNVFGKARCGNAIDVINLDLRGNIYRCHNDNVRISDIYEPLSKYKDISSINDKIIKEFIATDCFDCFDCDVADYCQGGCPLVCKTTREKSDYCRLRKTLYEEYRKMAAILTAIRP